MKDDEGFNAQTEQYENLVKAGVIDPTKVVRSALQNAASIASLLLTTEALISEIPEEKKACGDAGRRHGRRDVLTDGATGGTTCEPGNNRRWSFSFQRLKEVSGPNVDHQELLYNASVLAHYAQVSTHTGGRSDDACAHLSAVFDHFVFDTSLRDDSAMMEAAGAQCLLLAGFFEDQLRRRHNIRWYAHLGVGFFSRAAALERSPQKVRLLAAIAAGFEPWRQRHARLSRELRDQSYLLMRPPRFDIGQAGCGHPGLHPFRVTGAARCTPPATAGSWSPCRSNSGPSQ